MALLAGILNANVLVAYISLRTHALARRPAGPRRRDGPDAVGRPDADRRRWSPASLLDAIGGGPTLALMGGLLVAAGAAFALLPTCAGTPRGSRAGVPLTGMRRDAALGPGRLRFAEPRIGRGRRATRVTCPSCAIAERGGPQVLRRVRRASRGRLPVAAAPPNPPTVRFCGECGSPVAGRRRRRRPAGAAVAAHGRDPRPPAPGRGAAPRHGAVRRPRRVHHAGRGPGPGGGPRAAVALLRPRDRGHRALRRHGREVHRRRGDGASGAPRPRTRTTRSAPSGPALDLVDAVRGLGPGIQARLRRPHRRGRGDPRRHGPGHGRRRPRQHRVAAPVRRAARDRARRRGDPAGDAPARSRTRRPASTILKGKAAPGRRVARAAGRGRASWPRPRRPARGPVRRPRRRAAAAQGPVPRDVAGAAGPPRVDHRPGGHRQEPPRLGVPQVRRRRRRAGVVARGPLAVVRRGDHVLGAGRDGPVARAGCSRATTRRRPARGSPRCSPSTSPTRRSAAGSSRPCSPSSASARRRRAARRSCSAAWRTFFERLAAHRRRRAAVRGPPVGGPGHARLRRAPARVEPQRPDPDHHARPARSCSTGGPAGAPAGGRSSPWTCSRSTRRRCASCSAGLVAGPAGGRRPVDRRAGRGHPAVRRRDHPDARRGRAPAWSARAAATSRPASSASSRSRARCTR